MSKLKQLLFSLNDTDRKTIEEKLKEKDDKIKQLEQELAEYKELQDQLGLENADEFEWFVMLDLLTDNEKNMHILDLHRELAELKEKAIVPKFKIGQEVWYIDRYGAQKDTIISFTYFSIGNEFLYKMHDEIIDHREKYIFATEQEAFNKLKEIQGNE